jgi:hypothetical protein
MAMLPVPLLSGNDVWHAVQLLSRGALVFDGVGPEADASTSESLIPMVPNPKMPKTIAKTTASTL